MAKITSFITVNNPVRKYRLKEPVIVEARQFTADEAWECLTKGQLFWGQFRVSGEFSDTPREVISANFSVHHPEGIIYWTLGDYVVRGDGEYYGVKKEIFEAKYELVTGLPCGCLVVCVGHEDTVIRSDS